MRDTYPQIEKDYIDTGKIRYATLDFPLESIHKSAFSAALATECANDQDKFSEMHDRLFENQKAIDPVSAHAEALGLDMATFNECMDSKTHAKAVRADMVQGQKAGVAGTPSFVLAETDPNDPTKVKGISFIRGAQAFNAFKAQIDAALGE